MAMRPPEARLKALGIELPLDIPVEIEIIVEVAPD